MIEDNNQGFFMGMRPFTMAMNKYGDLVRSNVFPSSLPAIANQSILSNIKLSWHQQMYKFVDYI